MGVGVGVGVEGGYGMMSMLVNVICIEVSVVNKSII